MILRRIKFERLTGGMSAEEKAKEIASFSKKETDYLRSKRIRLSSDDFQVIQVIGKGAFGTVLDHRHLIALR